MFKMIFKIKLKNGFLPSSAAKSKTLANFVGELKKFLQSKQ